MVNVASKRHFYATMCCMEPLDAVDRRILTALQRDGRMPNVALADEVNLSPSPCLRRVKRLEEAGVIGSYRAALDRRRVGLGLTLFVEIKVSGHSDDLESKLEAAFHEMDEVVAAHIVSGPSADFLLEVVVPDLEAYERLLLTRLLTLPSVTDVNSNFAIRTIKSNGALPLGHLGRS
jgi:Lrp/AsnC family transcriptional regulator, leucine-responsive regulatory protein